MDNKWYEIAVFTTDAGIDAVCAAFAGLGIEGTVIEESRESMERFLNSTAQYWDYADLDSMKTEGCPCVKAYVQTKAEAQNAEARFLSMRGMEYGVDLGSLNIEIRESDAQDWANNWKQYYKPLKIGKRLLVCPSWEETANDESRTLLKLDPGMAFGTGSHPTTSMCLEYIERSINTGDVVLDLGCGSGILFIAALLLDARFAVGVDIDADAQKAAKENAALNGISQKNYTLFSGDILKDVSLIKRVSSRQYDIIAANIVASVITQLCPLAYKLIKSGGTFITSGIIYERLDEVVSALTASGFIIAGQNQTDDWRALICKKP